MLPNIVKKERELGDVRSGLKSFKPLRLNQQVLAVAATLQDQ
jgi:hypothetical protein